MVTTTKKANLPRSRFAWNEARQTLAIGKRSGKFPGMLKERTFHVVFVSPGHGTGMAAESHADAVIRYTGKAATVRAKELMP